MRALIIIPCSCPDTLSGFIFQNCVLLLLCSVILLPIAVTFYVTWWFIRFFDGFFSPIYDSLGIHVLGELSNHVLDLSCDKSCYISPAFLCVLLVLLVISFAFHYHIYNRNVTMSVMYVWLQGLDL